MQNISFLIIVSVLLGCAFFFSQLTNLDRQDPAITITPGAADDTEEVIPACTGEMSLKDQAECYSEAASVSEKMVNDVVDRILEMESDPDERISFMDVQFDWEDSRDTDCADIPDQNDTPQEAEIKESICLRDQNLARSNYLESYYCDWYGEGDCSDSASQGD